MNKEVLKALAEALQALGEDTILINNKLEVSRSRVAPHIVYVEDKSQGDYHPNLGFYPKVYYYDTATGDWGDIPF